MSLIPPIEGAGGQRDQLGKNPPKNCYFFTMPVFRAVSCSRQNREENRFPIDPPPSGL